MLANALTKTVLRGGGQLRRRKRRYKRRNVHGIKYGEAGVKLASCVPTRDEIYTSEKRILAEINVEFRTKNALRWQYNGLIEERKI